MTPDELRALADCLDDQNAMQREARRKAAAILRQIAEARAVAWQMQRSELLALADRADQTYSDNPEVLARLATLARQIARSQPVAWLKENAPERLSAPAAPQADPKREPLSDERIAEIQRAAYERAAQECESRATAPQGEDYLACYYACADAIRALGRLHG